MIKYQFAKNELNALIDIQEISRDTLIPNTKFYCLGCGNEVIPVLGKKVDKHFRHKNLEPNCQPETYLHKLAKETFYKIYQECIIQKKPFYIKIKNDVYCDYYQKDLLLSCKIKKESDSFDVTQFFPKIEMETRNDSFIPDVVLYSTNDKSQKIFIEIAVTHFSSKQKIESGNKIIEIKIESEKDIEILSQDFLEESDKVSFTNFKRIPKFGNFCQGKCIKEATPDISPENEGIYFVIDNNGMGNLFTKNHHFLKNILLSKAIFAKSNKVLSLRKEYAKYVALAFIQGYIKRECFLCKNHKSSNHQQDARVVFCSSLKEHVLSRKALECEDFDVDKEKISQYTSKDYSYEKED